MRLQHYPSLSNRGRHQLANANREFWKEDSGPPNEAFDSNDIGVVFSIGWNY